MITRFIFFSHTYQKLITFGISGAIGIIIFLFEYGTKVLNPANITWIQTISGDISQHYLGWVFYRQSEWTFPIGAIQNLAYPHGVALTFTDSIPLFAIPFKVLSPILPEPFQYFGLWGIMSFILMGGISALVLLKLTKSIPFSVIGSVFFSVSPLVFDRMFGHTALAGQWVLMACILLLISISRNTSVIRFIIAWSVALAVSVSIHPYFLPMCAALMCMSAVLSFAKIKDLALRIVIPGIVAIITFWVIGGFMVRDVSSSDLGLFGYDPVTGLFNALGWSSFLLSLSSHPGSYEGFAYVGLGVILLVVVLTYQLITRVDRSTVKRVLRQYTRRRWLVIYLIGLGLLIASVSPTIHILNQQIVVPLPNVIEKVWSIFRSTGRLFWPLYYLIVIGLLVGTYKLFDKKANKRFVIGFFILLLTVQSIDILRSYNATFRRQLFTTQSTKPYISTINTAVWQAATKGKQHIQYLDTVDTEKFFAIAYFASAHHLTLSDGYFARSPQAKIDKTRAGIQKDFAAGSLRDDTLYITRSLAMFQTAEANGFAIVHDGEYGLISKR